MLAYVELSIDQVLAERNSRLTTDDGALLLAKEIVEKGGWNPVVSFQFKLRCEEDWET
jgi:hypothetical protein